MNRLSLPEACAGKLKGGFFYALKKGLSFVFPIQEAVIPSRVSGSLQLTWWKGRLLVNNGNANYSFGNLHRIFQHALQSDLFLIKQAKHILIIGFGAGSIYHILRKELNFTGKICGVDLDPVMFDLFRQWYPEKDELLELYAEDAATWHSSESYDLVLIDLFIGLEHSALLLNDAFIRKIKALLKPEGKILINTIFSDQQPLQRAEMLGMWNLHFKRCKWIPDMNSNFIMECS